MIKKVSCKNLFNCFYGIVLVLIWLMPVSERKGALSTSMNNRMYMFFCGLILISLVIESLHSWSMSKKELCLLLGAVFTLLFFTIVGSIKYPNAEIGIRELAIYFTLFIILSIRCVYIEANSFWRAIFWLFSTAIAFLGILMLLNNERVWDFFSTYYVNHLYYIYTEYKVLLKPVTFFAAHSISCFVYFLIYMTWEFCESRRHKFIAWIYKGIFAFLIIACRNNTSLFCIVMILMYYICRYSNKMTAKRILIAIVAGCAIFVAVFSNFDLILSIVNSQGNGILGRFTTVGAGNLVYDMNYIFSGGIPTGVVFAPKLFYTDCGMLVYILRGGFILPILIYISLYRCLKYYLLDDFKVKYIFICILGFEIGYAALIAQRFLPLFLFFLLYNKMFNDEEQRSVANEFNIKKGV